MKNPCKGCQRRSPTCHSECAEYLELRADNEKRYKEKLLAVQAQDYTRRIVDKKKHRQQRRAKI